MKRLRFWLVMFSVWLFLLYNIERIHEPINLASFVYVFVAAVAIFVLCLPAMQRVDLRWLFLPSAAIVLLLKLQLGYSIAGAFLPITVTELCAVALTIVLSRQVGRNIEEFRDSAINALVSHFRDSTLPFERGQEEFYREIRRARAHHRPLTLLAISPVKESAHSAIDRVTKEIQRETIHAYSKAKLAELLTNEAPDCAVITQSGDDFYAILPETDSQAAAEFTKRLETQAHDKLKLDVQVGLSFFPDEEVTFVELMQRAKLRMNDESHNGHDSAKSNGNGRKYRKVNGESQVNTSPLADCRDDRESVEVYTPQQLVSRFDN